MLLTGVLPEAVPSLSSVFGAILVLPTKRILILKAKPIDRDQLISYPKPMLYLFRSKIYCYTVMNAVTSSILLVDFDRRVALAVLEVNKV